MDEARWSRLQQLFAQALALAPAQREDFVAALTGADRALAAELRGLLRHDDPSSDRLPETLARAAAGLLDAARDGLLGQRLGAWRIVSHLADGGMGSVYRAERADGQYEQAVAVKLLNPARMSAGARARLEAERQILARLAHPLIARLLDGGRSAQGAPYLVMEFVDGEPIDQYCERHALDTAARLRLVIQVCQAVDFAHRNLVVHRDLKPGNILVDAQGTPRLLDFGIARLLDDEGLTASAERLLTPSHASPEQVSGGAITTATDVYALGVLLYQLLAGRLPHAEAAATSPAALARAIVETDAPRPSSVVQQGNSGRLPAGTGRAERLTLRRLARELTGDLDNIVLMALRKEPARRYASTQGLADDLVRYLEHRPVRARADTLAYRGAMFLRRHPVAVPVSTAALLLVLAGGAVFTVRLAQERNRALAAGQQALQARLEAQGAERSARRTADFTASLLEGTGANEAAARQVSVRDLLDQAARRVDNELGAEPEVATRLRIALGSAYASWGANEAALKLLQAALAEARSREAVPGEQQAKALSLLSTVTHDLGQLDASLDWTRQAEALWARVGTPAQRGSALSDLAMALNALRRRDEAEPVFRRALAMMRAAHNGDHRDIAWAQNNLAWGLHAMGRGDEAAPLYEEALAMQQRLGVAAVERAQTQNNLAGLYYDRGDLDRAGTIWADVLVTYEGVFGSGGHAAVARAQNMVALVAIERGRFDEAARLTLAALQTNLRLLGERHRWTAITLQSHGAALLGLGRLAEAEALMRRSLAVRRAVLPAGHAEMVGPQLGLGRVALARGDAAAAERALRSALALIEAVRTPDRVPRDRVELALARAVALQGRRNEGQRIAAGAIERMRAALPATHWRLQAAQAALGLPPFVALAGPAQSAAARATLVALRERLGPGADVVRELAAALGE